VNPGNFATLAAIGRVSSFVSSLAADRRLTCLNKSASWPPPVEIISLLAVELAELFNLVATALAAFAALAALFLAIMGSNNPKVGKVP
jgi:hypothetical protein